MVSTSKTFIEGKAILPYVVDVWGTTISLWMTKNNLSNASPLNQKANYLKGEFLDHLYF